MRLYPHSLSHFTRPFLFSLPRLFLSFSRSVSLSLSARKPYPLNSVLPHLSLSPLFSAPHRRPENPCRSFSIVNPHLLAASSLFSAEICEGTQPPTTASFSFFFPRSAANLNHENLVRRLSLSCFLAAEDGPQETHSFVCTKLFSPKVLTHDGAGMGVRLIFHGKRLRRWRSLDSVGGDKSKGP